MFSKDVEGYTPYDVYNSTVAGTNPPDSLIASRPFAELFTWGSNRNATLGFGDGDDRSMPEQVVIKRDESATVIPRHEKLKPLPVIDISMSKLHTTIITAESKNNIRSCGFASGGRLGPGATTNSHSQFSWILPQGKFPQEIVSLALGQDHTLAVNSHGEVLSWGLNRFQQLGYVIEGSNRSAEEQIQAAARKITGPLRNHFVLGVACCKTASACWTSTQLFTWGTNNGQLGASKYVCMYNVILILPRGYEKTSQPQVLPRPVSTVTEPVLSVAMTNSTILVLLKNHDVICHHDGLYWKLT
jgi:alpha-tubulin suppressor-like RCC1 family protein